MYYYIDRKREKKNTAGAKAPADIAGICRRMHMRRFPMPEYPKDAPVVRQKIWLLFVAAWYWGRLFLMTRRGDIVIYQHPMYANRIILTAVPLIRKVKKCRFIALIHDLESLRGGIEGVMENRERTNELADLHVLKTFDRVICHNKAMKEWLAGHGFDRKKLVSLGLFDYLFSGEIRGGRKLSASIAVAGNLAPGKSGYLYRLREAGLPLEVHLYGINYEEGAAGARMIWHGSFTPEELPLFLEGSFGLVWDGPQVESCAGNTGEYLKYNDPHKTSLYLAAGLPVIVWDQAAVAPFILKNRLGIAVSSIGDIPRAVETLSAGEYGEMLRNAERISRHLRAGDFFRRAVIRCGNCEQ